ncbi:MAG: hypothetical protein ACRDRK_00525 [Pseudonocardia sp.]
MPGATPSGLVQRLVDDGLRMADHPGVTFRDGPAAVEPRSSWARKCGSSWCSCARSTSGAKPRSRPGEAALAAAEEMFAVPYTAVRAGLSYYAAFSDEIDVWIAAALEQSERAEQEWERQQALLL